MNIDIEPDPMIPAARALAEKINAKQTTLRVSNGVGYSARPTSVEENEWLFRYRQAEVALRRASREADRAARRASK